MIRNRILVALDSVGIDPLGHDRADSVYCESRFLFPRGVRGDVLPVCHDGRRGVLVETDVTRGRSSGAIECALTYASIFSGESALTRHGLMQGLGLKDGLLEEMVSGRNLFKHFERPCLANAIFPAHLSFLGSSYVQHLLPHYSRNDIEGRLRYCGEPITFKGGHKPGFAELFTLAEINQNIFVYAAREGRVRLRTWSDVRRGEALTSSLTHSLEGDFDLALFDQSPLPLRTPEEAAAILVRLAREHDFMFYKYQMADLVSHTGRIELARDVFATIERFIDAVLRTVDLDETILIVTSDHGHLEQVGFTQGHPKTNVPTWYFGPNPDLHVQRLRFPEDLYGVLTESNRT